MATTTKQNTQYCTTSPSIDANVGPWDSISAYTSWLSDTLGIDTPQEGTEILVKDDTGAITKYRYEVISGAATWKEYGGAPLYKGVAYNADNLYRHSDYGIYYCLSILKGLLCVSWDSSGRTTQHLLANQKPVYENGAISEYVYGVVFLTRYYDNNSWSEWVSVADSASDSAAAAATSAAAAAAALSAIQTAIENLDPSTSTDDAITTLAAQIAVIQAEGHPVETEEGATGNLDIADESGYVIARLQNGHIKTRDFDSSNVYSKSEVDSLVGSGSSSGVTQSQLSEALSYKQDLLSSGTNIKTINGHSILGGGNLNIGSSSPSSTRTIRILSIGNSYSADALMYFPYVFNNIVTDVNVVIGIASISSCTMEMHYNNAVGGNANYAYYKWNTSTGKWVSTSGHTLQSIVEDEEWDFITLQQKSTNSANYSTISPYLNPLIDWIFGVVERAVKIGWLMTPALPRGNNGLSNYGWNSDTFYASLVTTAQSILTKSPVSFVIPEGTAIQNCRKTSLNNLGSYTYNCMTYEGTHLQQGLPCLAASYLCVQYVLDMIGYGNKGIIGDSIRPTDALDDTWNILSQQGSCVGVTDANCLLAQKCVMMALKNPYEITDCGALFES